MTTVFLDTETTHLDPEIAEVWEIGLILRRPMLADMEVQLFLPVNIATADPRSLSINHYFERKAPRGMTLDPDRDGRMTWNGQDLYDVYNHLLSRESASPVNSDPKAVARWLSEVLLDAHIVANNPAFDAAILEKLMRRHGGLVRPWYHRLVDVRQLAIGYLYGQEAGLRMADVRYALPENLDSMPSNEVFKLVGVDPADFQPQHAAMPDARLVRAVFDRIIGQ